MSFQRFKSCFWFLYIVPFMFLTICEICGQTVSPKQILPATSARVNRPDLKYKLQSNPLDGGKFWYVVDTPSVSTGGGGGSSRIPGWQEVTNYGRTTIHSVTAAGLTLTNLTTGSIADSMITVRDGLLRMIPPPSFFPKVSRSSLINYDVSQRNPLPISSSVFRYPISGEINVWQMTERTWDWRQIVKDTLSIILPKLQRVPFQPIEVIIQSNIRKLEFVCSQDIPLDTMSMNKFQNVKHGTVFRCQSVTGETVNRWIIYPVFTPDKRADTVNVSPNAMVELSEFQSHVFLSSRTGAWQQGDGVEFKLPKFPSNGQEIVISNQIGVIQGNTEFRFTATGGYTFKFPNGPQKVFAYDPLSINTTANNTFVSMECQFRCVANTIDKRWSCFVTAQ